MGEKAGELQTCKNIFGTVSEIEMIYLRGTTEFSIEEPTVITFGKFDGIHRGHKLLLDAIMRKKEEELQAVVFTFDIPPKKKVEGASAEVLTINEEKMHIFENLGVDYVIECPFTEKIRNMEATEFIRMIVEKLHVKCVVVGTDFHFGHNRIGDYRLLQEKAEQFGYEVIVLDKMQSDGKDISSTYIREYIKEGNIEKANELLGYPYFVQGIVEHGNEIGRTIGFPTINLIPDEDKLLPPFGVYITRVFIGGEEYCGITNVGCKPTIEGENPVGVETHVLDFSDDVYDMQVEVEFLHRIRAEEKFGSIEELKAQLQQDIKIAKIYFDLT